jgi:hypothetical protein
MNRIWSVLLLSLIALAFGCAKSSPPQPSPTTASSPATESSVTRFTATRRQSDGRFATIGTFTIHPGGKTELTITGTGPDADKLRAAWADVQARPVLETKLHDANGDLVGEKVPRKSPKYPEALADVMSREFGFFLTPVRDQH